MAEDDSAIAEMQQNSHQFQYIFFLEPRVFCHSLRRDTVL